jgi:hypothetical protein
MVGAIALITGLIAGTIRRIGPRWEELYMVPAIIVAVAWAIGVAAGLRYVHRSEG